MLTSGFDGATGVFLAAFAGILANAVWFATLGRRRRRHRARGAGMFGTLSRRLDRARRSGRTRFIRGFALAVLLSAAGVAIGSGIEAVPIPPVYAGLAAAAPVALAVDRGAALDRKSVVVAKSVSVRIDLGGRRHNKKKNKQEQWT